MGKNGFSISVRNYLDRTLSGPVFTWRQIIHLIVPSALDSLSIMFINMLITALISENGETSVAAVSIVGPITGLILCAFQGLSDGGSVIVAQCRGRDDRPLLVRAIGMTTWLSMLIGVLICLPFLVFPKEILSVLYPTTAPDVAEKARLYLFGSIWSIIPFTLFSAIFRILRGLGESNRCLVLTIIINGGYLIFSFLFLNILHLDILGSVLALILARTVGTIAAVIALFVWKPPVKMQFREIFSFDSSLFSATMKVGIPFSAEQLCASCGGVVSQMYMIELGTSAIATQAIINSLMGLLYAPAQAAGTLAVAVVGRCIGAGHQDEAYRYGRRCNQIARLLLVLSAIVFYPALPLLIQQYHPTAQATALARALLYANLPVLLLFWPCSATMPSTLRSGGDNLFPTVVTLSVMWVISIGLGYFLAIPVGLGLWGIWIATWCAWTLRTALFHYRFRSRKWLHRSTLNQPASH